ARGGLGQRPARRGRHHSAGGRARAAADGRRRRLHAEGFQDHRHHGGRREARGGEGVSDGRRQKGTPSNSEYACIADWRAKHSEEQWGWLQFATMGRSWRVNSVWPLEWNGDGRTLDQVIGWCAEWAARHRVPLAFKLADGAVAPPEL